MSETLQWLTESLIFPPLNDALQEPNGLLAIGGDLSPSRLINAYSNGIFPWFNEGEPILWWSPNPRAIIPIDDLKVNRTLRKFIKQNRYHVTLNQAFEQVIDYCADAPFRKDGTWIVADMKQAYQQLHQLGYAQSVEIWSDNELVGGLYGVSIGGFFSGESMFYLKANASKVALVALSQLLASQGVRFIDCQIINPFLKDMGCIEISRQQFINQQHQEKLNALPDDFWQPRTINLSII